MFLVYYILTLQKILFCETRIWTKFSFISTDSKRENELYRGDGHCGSNYTLPNGSPGQCNPRGKFPCCSKWGHCGETPGHCDCKECIDYRKGNMIL